MYQVSIHKTLMSRTRRLLLALMLGPFAAVPAFAEEAVFVTGYTISTETPPEFPVTDDQMAMFGHAADIGLSMAMHKLGIDPGTPEYQDIIEAVDEFLDDVRPEDAGADRASFSALYQNCRMIFSAPPRIMSIRLPPGSSLAYMEAHDWSTGEGFSMELNRDLSRTDQAVGKGWNSGTGMTPTGNTDTMLGFEVTEYTFNSTGGLGNMGGAVTSPQGLGTQGNIASMVSVSTSGRAWVTDEAEGLDIIQAFYRNFASQIVASQGANSFYAGLMTGMVEQLQHGLPLHISTNTESKVAGKTMMSGRSESWITSPPVVIERDENECSVSTLPTEEEGSEITHISAGNMPGARGAGGAGPGDPGSPGSARTPGGSGQAGPMVTPCDCSCSAFERLQKEGENRDGDDGGPKDQAMAQCMMQCMQQYMACAMQRR